MEEKGRKKEKGKEILWEFPWIELLPGQAHANAFDQLCSDQFAKTFDPGDRQKWVFFDDQASQKKIIVIHRPVSREFLSTQGHGRVSVEWVDRVDTERVSLTGVATAVVGHPALHDVFFPAVRPAVSR